MLEAVRDSLAELRQWMSWAQTMPTTGTLRDVLRQGQLDFDADRSWEYAIFDRRSEQPIGGAGVHGSDRPDRFEIGYWVRTDRTGEGIATAAARSLVDAAFAHLSEAAALAIRMDQANRASAAIPPKLGFTLDHEEDRDVVAVGHTGRGYVWLLHRSD
jgi:RimJ/RimL family protein N-acetyltransferase